MKKYSVIIIVSLLMLNSAWAKVKNGYEENIQYVREQLKNCNDVLNAGHNLSASKKRNIKNRIKNLIVYESYYELTEELLARFKRISPHLYNRIDAIRDSEGRPTDVYVKFIPREEALIRAGGVTRMAQSDKDMDACFSEYGQHSVSITIWLFNKALFALAHEFGHVNYQVPNLEAYAAYYKGEYADLFTESNHLGHSYMDPSGKSAETFEKEFSKNYRSHLKLRKDDTPASPYIIMEDIKRRINNSQLQQWAMVRK